MTFLLHRLLLLHGGTDMPILNGAGAPSDSQGSNGDFYYDTTNKYFYGPKASGVWSDPVPLDRQAEVTVYRSGTQSIPGASTDVEWSHIESQTKWQPFDGGNPQKLWLGAGSGTGDCTFAAAAVSTANDNFVVTSHDMLTGDGPVQLTSSGTLFGGPSLATDYWIIKDDADTYGIATSRANAIAGTRVTITSQGTGTHNLDVGAHFAIPEDVNWVQVEYFGGWADGSDATHRTIWVDGSAGTGKVGNRFVYDRVPAVNGSTTYQSLSAILDVSSTTRLTAKAAHGKGSAVNFNNADGIATFTMRVIG